MKTHILIAFAAAACLNRATADELADAGSKVQVQPVVPLKVRAFPLTDVRLLDGPFKHAQDLDHQYLLELEVDRLLHNFRVNAGLPSNAQPLGGWEETKGELRGHFVGHYLSACALMYASTGDARLKAKGDAVVAGLAECQAKLGSGYLSAFPESFIDRVEARRPVWAPYYTLHKILAGLLEMYVYGDNRQALATAKKFADWVIARNGRLTDAQMQRMLDTEHGGMNEALANLYGLTGEEKYLQIALRFNHQTLIGPASQRQDNLTGKHANTQFPKFIGAAREYELTGRDDLKTAVTFFWNTVVQERSYVIGGNSDGEMFSAKERLSQALGPNTTETCNTYNMLRLTRHLFCWDPQVEYADYYERALYNHILASQNPVTGMMCYYVPLRSGARRNFNGPNDSFWCCTGTGVENHGKYGDSIYFHNDHALYVNLFIASELHWRARGLTLRQETAYPDNGRTRLIFTCDQPVELTLQLRHPAWAAQGLQYAVNGEPPHTDARPGGWITLARTWKSGDRVELTVPFTLRAEAFADNPNRFAFLNGPLVLCAQVDPRRPFPVVLAPVAQVVASLSPVSGKPNTFAGATDVFRIPDDGPASQGTLEPFYQVYNRPYEVYWDHLTPEQWQTRRVEYEREQARLKEVQARTVDVVLAGEESDEQAHHFSGTNTDTRTFNDRTFRFANTNGWFAWELKVLPDQPQELSVRYGGGGRGGSFDILVDGAKLATETPRAMGRQFRPDAKVYPLPAERLKGKPRITVRFQAGPNARISGVYEVRVLKAAAEK